MAVTRCVAGIKPATIYLYNFLRCVLWRYAKEIAMRNRDMESGSAMGNLEWIPRGSRLVRDRDGRSERTGIGLTRVHRNTSTKQRTVGRCTHHRAAWRHFVTGVNEVCKCLHVYLVFLSALQGTDM